MLILSLLLTLLAGNAQAADLSDRLEKARQDMVKTQTMLGDARRRFLDVPSSQADLELTLARMYLDTADLLQTMGNAPERVPFWLSKAEESLSNGRLLLTPGRSVEARGLFLDAGSIPKSKSGIRELLTRIKAAHFNMILPEVFRRGYTIYPSRYTAIDPEFSGHEDLFPFLMKEARRLDLEVHPWLWCFRVRSPGYGDPILSRLPALASRSNKTTEPRFLSPASPEARRLVADLIGELVTTYQPQGVMMDYIRYDEETPEDWISLTRFRLEQLNRTGKFPSGATKEAWQLWREEQVNAAVAEISRRLHASKQKPALAAAIFRGEKYARTVKMQNWRHWANNRWIQWVSPMLYTNKEDDLSTWIGWESDGGTRRNLMYPILGLHRMDDPVRQLPEQIETINRLHQGGVMFFALAHLPNGTLENLAAGPFRKPAYPPHRNLIQAARRALVETSNRYLGMIYHTADIDTAASALVLWQEMKKIEQTIPFGELPYAKNDELLDRIDSLTKLAKQMNTDGHFPSQAVAEFGDRLEYAKSLVRANALMLEKKSVPSSRPPKG